MPWAYCLRDSVHHPFKDRESAALPAPLGRFPSPGSQPATVSLLSVPQSLPDGHVLGRPWLTCPDPIPCYLGPLQENYPRSLGSRSLHFFLLFLNDFIYLFLDRGEGKEKERGKTSMCGCLSSTPYRGPGLQPRHVPCLGIELATLRFTGQHSIN